jgi:cytochrome P450
MTLIVNRISSGEKWHNHRRMITPTFHVKILDSFVEVFWQNSEILVRMMQKEVGAQGFDVYPYITLCALDILCGECLSKPGQSKHFCRFFSI